jgi:crenactin
MNEYRSKYTFGMDFGTSDFKYGPITCAETPRVIKNRGYIPDKNSIMLSAFEKAPDVIVGENVPLYLQSSEDLSSRLVYPMRKGIIERDDQKAWSVVEEISRFSIKSFEPNPRSDFEGFFTVASISSVCPRYMFERLFEIFERINEEKLLKASTIIPQPFAVAIGHGITTCVVIESGHGNSQICPISRYPIRKALVALNRGGSDANAITAEILKDAGYGDLVHEEAFVTQVKEKIGLVPLNLDRAVEAAKKASNKFRARFKVPGTRIEIDLERNSWTRFLIGEYVFNPNHELFESYFSRGMSRPTDVKIGDTTFRGMIDFGEAIIESVERCPIELQPMLYKEVILSGGNFSWAFPSKLSDQATDAPNKIRLLLREKGIKSVSVRMTRSPKYSVWHGCIVYGYAVPEEYLWSWERFEGWMKYDGKS